MKAMILAAGRGERLRPLTDRVPKPMVPIAGRPLLEYTVEWLRGHGCTDLAINLHYRPEVIREHFGDGAAFGVSIHYSLERELLGTAGALLPCRQFFDGDTFLVMYGDNLTNLDLGAFLRAHRDWQALATMAVHHRDDVIHSGMAVVEPDGRLVAYREKPRPEEVTSHWVGAGIILFEPAVFDYIPPDGPSDLSRDVMPALVAANVPLYAYKMCEKLRWADSWQDYQELERLAAAGELL
ncbi:MAG TPA: nucleotidyltransferase family protein [Chloroflexota bacterium]